MIGKKNIVLLFSSISLTLVADKLPNKELIDQVYKDISGFKIDADESSMITTNGGAPTYGEITFEALKTILDDMKLTKDDVFYDLGCGVGKASVQVVLETPAKAVGVELSPTRVHHAQKAQRDLVKTKKIAPVNRLQFREKNILDEKMKDATVVFLCSTCFSGELMQKITDTLAQLKNKTRVISLKPLPKHPDFVLVKTYKLPMTWSSNTPVYVYQLKKKEPNKAEKKQSLE